MKWFVYIVRCSDNSLYTGISNNLLKRIETHNLAKGAKYTKARLPVELVYFKEFENKSLASKEEYRINQLKKFQKELLINLDV